MSMDRVEVFVGLLIAAIPLVGLARRWQIPYPIVLVIGGLVLGFVPGLPRIELPPDLVLLIFLPPLLYWESITAPTDEMRANARMIWPLAVGLVILTTSVVALVAHALVPALGWAAAFVLGAIVAPTDEIAAVPIAERLGVPRHVTAIIQGEALLNDAGSLVLYAAAVASVVTGTFSWAHASLQFVLAAVGAVAIGLLAGAAAIWAWRQFQDTRLQAAISVLVPFVAYVPAQQLNWSGVLAVVTAGVFVNRYTPKVITPSARLQLVGWWETTVFLANAVIFILLGLQLHEVVTAALAHGHTWRQLLWVAAGVNAATVAVRFGWVYAQAALARALGIADETEEQWKHLLVVTFSGLRGAVSLAAALALPLTIRSGARFPERDLIVFVTFTVILGSLVVGGLSLPAVIARLHLSGDDTEEQEVRRALLAATQAALRRLDELERERRVGADRAALLRARYDELRRRYEGGGDAERGVLERYTIEHELLEAERAAILEMRRRGEIENKVMRRLQLTLDIAETQLQRFAGDAEDITDEDSELATSPPEPPSRRREEP
jgi:monovalent cation/hydrogen antiporter